MRHIPTKWLMRRIPNKFIVAFFLVVAFAADVFMPGASLLVLFVAIPFVFMALVDAGRAIPNYPATSGIPYVLGILLGLLQALFALVSVISGIAITVAFFLCSECRAPWWILPVGLGLIAFGALWIRDVFKRVHGNRQPHQPNNTLERDARKSTAPPSA